MGIVNYNIRTVESVQKVRRIQRPIITEDGDSYVATGDTLEQCWSGPWAELESKMGSLEFSLTRRLQATLSRIADGNMAELRATWTDYVKRKAETSGDSTSSVPGASREAPSYSVQVTCVQEPLLTHPSYASLDDISLTALKMLMDGGKPSDVVTIGDNGLPVTLEQQLASVSADLVKRIKRGQTHYLAPQVAVTARYRAKSIPDTATSFTISEPPGGINTPAGHDWLFIAPSTEAHGDEVWVSETYLLSGAGGWDKAIYG